jgi:hypothetical protein
LSVICLGGLGLAPLDLSRALEIAGEQGVE